MFKTEKKAGRRADWFFWHDDDVVCRPDIIRQLRQSAHPVERPFVAAVGYDRNPPYQAAVWTETTNDKGLVWNEHWVDARPGLHKVAVTGLCAAIFHRSFFDRLPQPWFASMPPSVDKDGDFHHSINTDAWLCQQCKDNDIPIYVNGDIEVTHMGNGMPINKRTVKGLREIFPKTNG